MLYIPILHNSVILYKETLHLKIVNDDITNFSYHEFTATVLKLTC